MGSVRFLRVAWLAAAAAAGCGGQLVMPDGGATGRGGAGGGGGGAPGTDAGWPADEIYFWGDVTVYVTAPGVEADGIKLRATPPGNGTVFAPATTPYAGDGAFLVARYTCTALGLFEVDVYNCPGELAGTRRTVSPGCVAAVFTPEGVTGNYVDTTLTSCEITAGTAELRVPHRFFADGTPSQNPAVGTFTVECQDANGNVRVLDAVFALPVQSPTLAC